MPVAAGRIRVPLAATPIRSHSEESSPETSGLRRLRRCAASLSCGTRTEQPDSVAGGP
jgi:hypothetical protein